MNEQCEHNFVDTGGLCYATESNPEGPGGSIVEGSDKHVFKCDKCGEYDHRKVE